MSCDEAAIRKIGGDVRADYSASLLTLATGRRIIAGTPLAFGEGDTKGRIKNLAEWKKPAIWIVGLSVAACVIVAVCLLTNPLKHNDYLRLMVHSTSGKNQAQYKIELGNQVFSGTLYAEQWVDGTCIRSAPLTMDQHVEEIQILASARRENGSMVGTDIQIETGENESSLITYFAFPEDNSIRGWSFTAYELKEKVTIFPGDEVILAAIAFDVGNGVRAFAPETLINTPERLSSADYMLVIRACFSSGKFDNQHTEPVLWSGELIPGTTYVPYECLYMNPLSSYAAMGGDSGCKYIVGEDYFETVYRSNRISINATNPDADTAQHRIKVSKWKWQKFPYTDEEWASLYWPKGIWSQDALSKQYNEMLYQPLTANKFLLKMDNSLWLVDISNDPKVGTYIWSIYSLVPESAMGVVLRPYAKLSHPLFSV